MMMPTMQPMQTMGGNCSFENKAVFHFFSSKSFCTNHEKTTALFFRVHDGAHHAPAAAHDAAAAAYLQLGAQASAQQVKYVPKTVCALLPWPSVSIPPSFVHVCQIPKRRVLFP